MKTRLAHCEVVFDNEWVRKQRKRCGVGEKKLDDEGFLECLQLAVTEIFTESENRLYEALPEVVSCMVDYNERVEVQVKKEEEVKKENANK